MTTDLSSTYSEKLVILGNNGLKHSICAKLITLFIMTTASRGSTSLLLVEIRNILIAKKKEKEKLYTTQSIKIMDAATRVTKRKTNHSQAGPTNIWWVVGEGANFL